MAHEKAMIEGPRKLEKEQTPESMSERVENVYALLREQNENKPQYLRTLQERKEEISEFISKVLHEMDELEQAARRDPALLRLSPELARGIGLVWTFSGPGTYYEPTKNDRYRDLSWAHGMDRKRLDFTARLARRIAEESSGVKHIARPDTINETVQANKGTIRDHGPMVVYNGTPAENEAVERVLAKEGTVVPAEKVVVIKEPIDNTLDQIRTFGSIADSLESGKKIAIVSHAAHIARIMRMINTRPPFKEGTDIIVFPLPTMGEKRGELRYDTLEAAGLVYYTFLTEKLVSTEQPYPYTVYGNEV